MHLISSGMTYVINEAYDGFPPHSQTVWKPKLAKISDMGITQVLRALIKSFWQCIRLENPINFDHITDILTIYPIIFSIGKSGPTKNWPYSRKDLISGDHITGSQCNLDRICQDLMDRAETTMANSTNSTHAVEIAKHPYSLTRRQTGQTTTRLSKL